MRSIVLLAACVGEGVAWSMPETWAEAHARANLDDQAIEVKKHHSQSKVHLKSVLASEVGIIHKTEYWGKVFVGTPAKEFSVIFDTGSGNLILPSMKCTSVACNSHEKYDPANSKTGLLVGKEGKSIETNPEQRKEATIKFGTGKIHGQFYQDKLCLGGHESACYTANFIGTDYESEMPFDQCSFDGIMGLGFKDLSMGEGFNMVDDVVGQHSLPSNKFSVYLKDHEEGSEITFGGYKKSQVASDIFWAPVTRESYWQIGIDDVTFNNVKTGLCSKCQVAVDTGTSLLAGPSDVIESMGTKLDVKQDCSNFGQLPMMGFAVGNTVLNLLPDDYIDRSGGGGVCSLALMTLDVPPPKGPLFIFGDPFLRRFLTIYDRDGPRVGFAVAQHDGVTADSAKRLIGTVSDGTKKAEARSDDEEAEEDLIKIHSKVLRGAKAPVDNEDPLDALDNENLSWSSMLKGMSSGSKKKKKAVGGMLQTTQAEEQLITISLARTNKR